MGILCAMAILLQDPLPADAKQVVAKADAKLDALRKAYEEACAKVKIQEMKDLQRIHESIKGGDPAGASAVKAKIDALSADVNVTVKGRPSVEQWIQGKWILTGGNYGEVWEFKGTKVIGTGIGDRIAGRFIIDGGNVQVIWDSGLVEWVRVSESFSDETTGVGRIGALVVKRVKK